MEIGTVKDQTELSEITRPNLNQEDGQNSNFPITNTHTTTDYKTEYEGEVADQFTTKMTIDSNENTESACGFSHENEDENMKNIFSKEGEEFKEAVVKIQRDVKDAPLTLVDQDDGLMKFFGKACGVRKERLIDEDFEPYRKSTNNDKQRLEGRKTSGDEDFGENKMRNRAVYYDARVGERLARQSNDTKTMPFQNEAGTPEIERVHNDLQSKQTNLTGGQKTDEEKQRMYIKRSETRAPAANKGSYPNQTNAQVLPPRDGTFPRSIHAVNNDMYNFTHSQRGYMMLIVNDQFARQSARDGAHWDLLKMKEIGRKFGFRSLNYNQERNLTKRETLQLLSKAKNTDHSDCDCFMFMISTHGLEQRNARKGGQVDHALICADDQMIFTSTIVEMFNDTNCPTLKGKPKIFYIQACRGEDLDHGGDVFVAFPRNEDKTCSASNNDKPNRRMRESFDVSDTNWGDDSWASNPTGHCSSVPGASGYSATTRSPPSAHQHATIAQPSSHQQPSFMVPKVSNSAQNHHRSPNYRKHIAHAPGHLVNRIYAPTPYAIVETPSLKCDNDMLVMYAIPSGMFAWRNTSEGSWMIDYLHQVLMAYDMRKPKSFLNLMTKVSALMSRRTTNTPSAPSMHAKKAVSVVEHKLDKDIIFKQKVPVSEWVKTSKS